MSVLPYCDTMTSVTIPASVTTIGEIAFLECTSLTSVTIPAGDLSIPIALETTTNLATGPWTRLHTGNLTSAPLTLFDPVTTSDPARFYRIVGP